jgi:hypothetical protein
MHQREPETAHLLQGIEGRRKPQHLRPVPVPLSSVTAIHALLALGTRGVLCLLLPGTFDCVCLFKSSLVQDRGQDPS